MDFRIFVPVVFFSVWPVGCQPKGNSDPDSDTLQATTSAEDTGSEDTTSVPLPTGTSASTDALSTSTDALSTSSGTDDGGSSGTATVDCLQHTDRVQCEGENPECVLLSAREVQLQDGVCVEVASDVGFCMFGGTGGSRSPAGWYEEATQRVFSFSVTPFSGPEGWSKCSCGPPSPEACKCTGSALNCP